MNSTICTLFEGHYHYGLAALTNSLYKNGFRGNIYAGYKGDLPKWAAQASANPKLNWPGAMTMIVAERLYLHFLPLETDYHLTNYKPDFMLRLWEGPAKNSKAMFYFDPDITVKCSWVFFEQWAKLGVALVHEVVSLDMPANHPKRLMWKSVIEKCEKKIERKLSSYINGGFCGISKSNIDFLYTWAKVIETAIKFFGMKATHFAEQVDRTSLFPSGDQDALNIAAMCCQPELSEFGPEGMDFLSGGWLMSHATAQPKPWNKNFIFSVLAGKAPSRADKAYWQHVHSPIRLYTNWELMMKRFFISLASFMGRFYRR